VFNYPTMAECYKVAALDGLNKLSLWAEVERASATVEPALEDDGYMDFEKLTLLADV
jgi:hypothetical protein